MMPLVFVAAALTAVVGFASAAPALKPTVTQTFFVPLQESQLLTKGFYKINLNAGKCLTFPNTTRIANSGGMINNLISMTISTDNTVIFYDHWEDGYEVDHSNPVQTTTEIWGDRNATNGCAPSVAVCTDATDLLTAGTPIIIAQNVTTNNTVNGPDKQFRYPSQKFYDGGDRIGSNFPIAIVRAAFPVNPGSRMAGGCEVFDTSVWGTQYEAPLGTDFSTTTEAFEYVNLFVMAGSDGTNVTYQTGDATYATATMNMGDMITFSVKQAYTLVSTSPVQVHMITGDVGSNYEMRWYALLPTTAWGKNFLSPLGDSIGMSKLIFYNPNLSPISVSYDYLFGGTVTSPITTTVLVQPKKAVASNVIPTGSAAKVYSNGTFIALSWTDSEVIDGRGSTTNGQAYDWGFPVMPSQMLTPQVMIGLGFGCTFNKCNMTTRTMHSVVWITPANDATIYVDYNNNGTADLSFDLKALSGRIIRDPIDLDLSGTLIWATRPGTGPEGTAVDLAAAWGQDPGSTRVDSVDDQDRSMDLGTVVVPFPIIRVSKTVSLTADLDEDGLISPGDVLTYSIRVTNSGQVNIGTNQIMIVDNGLDTQLTYVPGSTFYKTSGGSSSNVADDTIGATKFPIDEAGIYNMGVLARRGGQHEIVFNVTVVPRNKITGTELVNSGFAQYATQPPRPFSVTVPINLGPTTSPTLIPTAAPTAMPTKVPTKVPSMKPTVAPTMPPTMPPTSAPTLPPTEGPTENPTTSSPTTIPTSPPRYAPPGPLDEGACPVPYSRLFLDSMNDAPTPVVHNIVGPGYKRPKTTEESSSGP